METKDKRIMVQAKKLIEVAMPVKEISAESVTDVRIQHGHISSLHTWWARRPLPVCRAVVLASILPDPLDPHCPKSFIDALESIVGKDNDPLGYYKPYDDIPYTSAVDKMDDNLRNRLMMFIGKFSEQFIRNEKLGKKTEARETLSDFCLIKWDNKNNEHLLNQARKLIWVAHNSSSDKSAKELIQEFDLAYEKIKKSEECLYNNIDRHLVNNKSVKECHKALESAIEEFVNRMPKIFDPFAGGGAIPLEAARLGCKSYGNDINPVAHIIQKGSLEFPQRFGKPISYSKTEFLRIYGQEEWNNLPNENLIYSNGEAIGVKLENRLSFDVRYYANKLLFFTDAEVGDYYPKVSKSDKPIAYYWARIAKCSNPSCKAEVPILRQFYLCNKKEKPVYLNPIIKDSKIEFTVKHGICTIEGWSNRGNLKCPCCGSITDVKKIKEQSVSGGLPERLLAVIEVDKNGKNYRLPTQEEIDVINRIPSTKRPIEKMQRNSAGGDTFSWGISEWGQMFTKRQLYTMISLVKNIEKVQELLSDFEPEYRKAILTYLAILIDRGSTRLTSFGVWNPQYEKIQPIFSRQAIPMVFDFPESVFTPVDGPIASQLDWILKVIDSESTTPFISHVYNASSGEKKQFQEKYLTAVITDPPYYDAIAYADLSDFFYVWLKRSLGSIYPEIFTTPQTPKSEECTALKHHHDDDKEKAKAHFENKLLQIFEAIEHQTSDIVSIMFAHQSTEAWTTLCNSILGAKMNITGSWALDTEMTGALKTDKAFLSSSVTVCAKPVSRSGIGNYKEVKKAIEFTVSKEVEELYRLGFRGADLLTACFGQAVSEFGKYEKVEKADGSEVTVAELLEMARESAFNALLKGFDGDDFTKFYIGWLQLYSFAESEFDDAAKFSRVGLSINVAELFTEHILIKNGNKQTLGTFEERIKANKNIGDRANNFLIDLVHRAMALYKGNNRTALLQYIGKVAAQPESNFWRVVTSLCEVLPAGSEDHKQALGLLTNKDSLIRESKTVQTATTTQTNLFES
jgi:adenine-specific DNA methylase